MMSTSARRYLIQQLLLPLTAYHAPNIHLASQLCDLGYTVHIVGFTEGRIGNIESSLYHLIRSRMKDHKVMAREIAIIGTELAASRVLNYLSDMALPMGICRVDVGAVVLIDPLPINSM